MEDVDCFNSKQKKLESIYYSSSHPAAFSSRIKLFNAARKLDKSIVYSDVLKFWNCKNTPSRYTESKKKYNRPPVVSNGPNELFLGDLCFFPNLSKGQNKGYSILLIVSDAFTKGLVAALPQKRKTGEETANNLDFIFKNRPCKRFFTDMGTEFTCGKSTAVYNRYNVKHYTSADPATKVSGIERLVKTFKQLLYKRLDIEKNPKKNECWIQHIISIGKAINSNVNRSTGFTPKDAALAKNQYSVWRKMVQYKVGKNLQSLGEKNKEWNFFKFPVGKIVRVSLYKDALSKSYTGSFSSVLYRIISRRLSFGVPTYRLEELLSSESVKGSFLEPEMMAVEININNLPKIKRIISSRWNNNKEEIKTALETEKYPSWRTYESLLLE